jgi:hypothetical protein
LELWLAVGGWRDVRVEIDGDAIGIGASATRDPNMSEFVGLLPVVPMRITTLTTLLECPCGEARLEIPVELLRQFRDAADDWKQIALIALYRRISVNGERMVPIEYARKIVALEVLRSGALPNLPDAMRRLRRIRNVCAALPDPELGAAIARLQSIRRTGALGQVQNTNLGDVTAWAGAQVVAGRWATILSGGVLT